MFMLFFSLALLQRNVTMKNSNMQLLIDPACAPCDADMSGLKHAATAIVFIIWRFVNHISSRQTLFGRIVLVRIYPCTYDVSNYQRSFLANAI
jgi:hypothetical protein